MNVLNLLASGGVGGIEVLCKNIALKSDFNNIFCFLFKEGEIYEELKKKNISVLSLKNKNKKIKKIVNEIFKYCEKEKIDIIVIHHGGINCNIIYILLKNKLKNVKFIRYLHGCYDNFSFGRGKNKIKDLISYIIMKKALKVSDMIIFASRAVKKSFEESFNIINKNKVVVYNGIGEEFFKKEVKKEPFKNRIVNIIFVGRIEKVKGVDMLIDTIKELLEDKINVKLTIVGEGTQRKKLEEIVKKENLQEKVIFTGAQSNVIEWLDKSDIFVYPSVWEEAFGISVAEAMARGCIPIVTNRGGLPEVVGSNEKYIVNDKIELKERIELFLKRGIDNIEIDKIREQARKFKIQMTVECLQKEYNNLIKE